MYSIIIIINLYAPSPRGMGCCALSNQWKTPWILLNTKPAYMAACLVPYCRPAESSSTTSSIHLPSIPISKVRAKLNCCRTPWLSHHWDIFFAPSSVLKRCLMSTHPESSSMPLTSWNRAQWIRICFGVSTPCLQGQRGELTPGTLHQWRKAARPVFPVCIWVRIEQQALVSPW